MIRSARVTDAAAIAAIYNQGIADRGATFDTTPRTVTDLVERLADVGRSPVLDFAEAAGPARVEVVLPETGVCATQFADEDAATLPASFCCGPLPAAVVEAPVAEASSGCCGGPPKAMADACCAKDEDAKAAGASGCGCSSPAATVGIAAPVPLASCG